MSLEEDARGSWPSSASVLVKTIFDQPPADHTSLAELAVERAKRLVDVAGGPEQPTMRGDRELKLARYDVDTAPLLQE